MLRNEHKKPVFHWKWMEFGWEIQGYQKKIMLCHLLDTVPKLRANYPLCCFKFKQQSTINYFSSWYFSYFLKMCSLILEILHVMLQHKKFIATSISLSIQGSYILFLIDTRMKSNLEKKSTIPYTEIVFSHPSEPPWDGNLDHFVGMDRI